jgi:hypothetical protein
MKNNVKKLVMLLLAICVFGAAGKVQSATVQAATSGDYEYEKQSDGTVWIMGYKGKSKSVTIPSQLGGRKVTGLDKASFCLADSPVTVTSVYIPASVTYIADDAFDSSKLVSIKVDAGNKVYDSRNNCNAIIKKKYKDKDKMYGGGEVVELVKGCKNTKIPAGVTVIGAFAFEGCSFTSIELPKGVKYIGYGAFAECKKLKKIALPSSLTNIGEVAFTRCTSLESVVIPQKVKKIEYGAFEGCKKLKTVNIQSTSLKEIGEEAFKGDKNLQKIVIKSTKLSEEKVGSRAIKGTSSNLVIKVPASVVEDYQEIFESRGNKDVVVK